MRHPADDPETFTHDLHSLLIDHGFYNNGDGWRRKEDARAGGLMPPPLSYGEAADELVARDRRAAVEGRPLRLNKAEARRLLALLETQGLSVADRDLYSRLMEVL